MGDMGDYWRDVKEYYRTRKPSKKEIEDAKLFREREEKRRVYLRNEIEKLGLEVKVYEGNGQVSIGKIIDWWTTTGTAIERKSRKQHYFDTKNPEYILETIKQLLSHA